jgi:sugar phosphate isomerase/epimerase
VLGTGQLGNGHVPLRTMRRAADVAGYLGPVELEVLDEVVSRYRAHVLEGDEQR